MEASRALFCAETCLRRAATVLLHPAADGRVSPAGLLPAASVLHPAADGRVSPVPTKNYIRKYW
jgi:hypothetical protein